MPTSGFEASCAERIAKAKKILEATSSSPGSLSKYSREQHACFEAQIRDGQDARKELITANLGLVASIASRYLRQGVEFSDLVQQGSIGLMRAVESFDHTLGYRFSTYAVWWIRHEILSFLADTRGVIRLPKHVLERIRQIEHLRADNLRKTGKYPTVPEIANEMSLAVSQVEEAMGLNARALSLDQPILDDGTIGLQNVIEDKLASDPQTTAAKSSLSQTILGIIEFLPRREQEIIRMRYGLEGCDACSYEEIAKKFGVTKNRIMWVESQVLQKLKRRPGIQDLRDYLKSD